MSTAETIEGEATAEEVEATKTDSADENTEEAGSFATQDHATGEAGGEEGEGKEGSEEGKEGEDSEESGAIEYAEFAVPEGQTIDDERLKDAHAVFGELELSQDKAQKLVDWYFKDQAAAAEQAKAAERQQRAEYVEEIRKDPALGGVNEKQTIALNAKALATFEQVFPNGRSFSRLLNETGLGDRIEVVDFLAAVGAAIREDSGGGGGENAEGNPLNDLYPTMAGDK